MADVRTSGRPRVSRIHSEIMIGAAIAATRSIQGKPNQIANSSIGPSTAADRTRVDRPRKRRTAGAAGALDDDTAIATFASPEFGDRQLEMLLAEVGPERVDEHQLGVGTLPEQEVADALLPARANQKIG